MTLCHCGSGADYANCCQPVHHNHAHATTPEQLMRARYCAHVLKLVDFIVATYHPSCHAEQDRADIESSTHSDWQKLEVLSTALGNSDNEGFVHFRAHFIDHNQAYCLEERSRFLREEGLWFYIDGEFPQQASQAKVGRNDPCPCGSGKKYKKCCG